MPTEAAEGREATAAEVTALWKDCYYPWLSNGWIECVCGEWFHSDKRGTARATDLHARHVQEVPHA